MSRHKHRLAAKTRKATNVSLDIALVAEAKRLDINISRACEVGLAAQIAKEHGRLWKARTAMSIGTAYP